MTTGNPNGSGRASATTPHHDQSEKTRLILMQAAWAQQQAAWVQQQTRKAQQAQQHAQQQALQAQQHAQQQAQHAQQQALAVVRALQQPIPSHNQVYPPHQGKLNKQHAPTTFDNSQAHLRPTPVASMLPRGDPFVQPTMLNQGSNRSSFEPSNTTERCPQLPNEATHQSQASNAYQDNDWPSFNSSNTIQRYPQYPNETTHRSQASNAYQDNDCAWLPSESPRYPQHSNETTHQSETAAFPVTLSAVVSAPPSVAPSEDFSNLVAPPVSTFLLHQACRLYAQTEIVIQSALLADPFGIRSKLPGVGYCYPINIALQHNASLGVLQLLCDADPSLLVEKDGGEECCSLTVALSLKFEMDVVSLILHANPDVVRVSDRHKNFPLHTACFYGSSLPIIELLCSTYPKIIRMKNFHGQTPLDIASRSSICSDDVINFLQHAAFGELEDCALEYLDSI